MRASIGLSSEVPRNTHMPFCPSAEELTGLLADALSTAERDALARHVEGCAPCQEQLARLTGIPDTAVDGPEVTTWLAAAGSTVKSVKLDGSAVQHFRMRVTNRGLEVTVRAKVGEQHTLTITTG